jgi:cell division protein FtsQ
LAEGIRSSKGKKADSRARRKRLRLLVAFIVVIVLASLSWRIYNSSLFEVREIRVEGNRMVKKDDILRRAGVERGMNLVKISARDVKERVQAEPWIQDVRVVKEYPDRLTLKISERKPIASIRNEGGIFVVDKDGYIWKNNRAIGRLPEVRDLPAPKIKIGERLEVRELRNALLCLNSMDASTYSLIVSLSAPSVENLTLQLTNGVLVSYGEALETVKKNYVLGLILSQARLKGEKLARIDLRVPSHPVVIR